MLAQAFPLSVYLKHALAITCGALLTGIAINTFLVPHEFVTGGISGVALVIHYLVPIPVWLMIVLLNAPLFIAGFFILGRDFLIGSLFGTVMLTIAVYATEGLAQFQLLKEPMLAAVFGALLSGVGIGITLRVNGSLGGTDIVGAIVKKFLSTSVGTTIFTANAFIILLSAGLFSPEVAAYGLINIFVEAMALDKTIRGINISKGVFIITSKPEEIAREIMTKLDRGVTYLHGEGAYYGNPRKILYSVVTLRQLSRVKYYVKRIDPHAFMSVAEVAEVVGEGFKPSPF